jgi:hypothetical protein
MAMRRDPLIDELLDARFTASAGLPFHLEGDDPDDPEQQQICEEAKALLERVPDWTDFLLSLGEADWYGKAANQVMMGDVRVRGRKRRTVTRWWPVNGDKITFDWDWTPGVLVHSAWTPPEGSKIKYGDRGRILMLDNPGLRRRFVIHHARRRDMDYLLEPEKATAIHGLGLRDRIYWYWWLRQELQSYWFDGLQRISTDGMLVGYYDLNNDKSKQETIASLKMLHRDKVAVFPRSIAEGKQVPAFEAIQPGQIAYVELREGVKHLEDEMRRMVLGQDLTSESNSTGMGSMVAELHDDTFTRIIRYDAKKRDETITRELLPTILRENVWTYRGRRTNELPFDIRYVSEIDRNDAKEKLEAAQIFAGLGGRLDLEQLGTDAGLPLDPAGQPTAADQQAEQMMQMMGGGGQQPPAGPKKPPAAGASKP